MKCFICDQDVESLIIATINNLRDCDQNQPAEERGKINIIAELNLNGIRITVTPYSDPKIIYENYLKRKERFPTQ
ncbi:MAG TPA: hypothetical protein VFM02_02420 [Candidatus Paceibacterota bacterium]|nr:hypothetical protein [Candidatus Paceibacterota bacterium]